jgi:hypothetical protein
MTDEQSLEARVAFLYAQVQLIVNELYGPLGPTAADPSHRSGGLVEKIDLIHDELKNGGIKRRWGIGERSVAVAIIMASASIVVAVIGYLGTL